MRWIGMSLLLFLLGCGPSQSDVENARQAQQTIDNQIRANELAAQRADAAARDCATRETMMVTEQNQAIERDKSTIMTTLGMVSSTGEGVQGTVGVTIDSLDAGGWSWVTAAVGSDPEVGVTGRVHYSVNPARLSSSVEIVPGTDSTGVRLRCGSGNCIRGIGRVTVEANGESETQDVDQVVSNAVWTLDTANRAQAVQHALSDLIGRTAHPPQTGSCQNGPLGNAAL